MSVFVSISGRVLVSGDYMVFSHIKSVSVFVSISGRVLVSGDLW